MHSALAGDDTGGRWSDKKKEGGGWNEKRSASRWREDEREGTRGAARGGGWGAPPGNFDAAGGGRWNRDRGGRDRRDVGYTAAAAGAAAAAGFQGDAGGPGGPGGWNDPVPVPGAGAKREPARPAGRGFSMGRGRGAGGFGGAGAGVGGVGVGAGAGGFLDGFTRRAPSRVEDGQGFVSALSGGIPPAPNFADAIVRHGPVRYKYSANDLLGRLGQLRAATGGTLPLPPAVDPDSVPLRTVKPGDQMWELTVEGARAARAGRERADEGVVGAPPAPKPRGTGAETTPEWSLESAGAAGSLGPGFLGGGAVPRLTAEEEARFNPATQPSWLTEGGKAPNGADLMGALESESDNTNRGGGVEDAQQQTQQQTQRGGAVVGGGGVPSQPVGPVTDAPWLYTDPSGTVQGPFQRAELIEWHESGYFPPDLPLRPADAPPSMPFVPLKEMLACGWRYPGPRVAAQMQQEQQMREQQMREQQMREQQMREQQMREQQMREQQMREQQMREQQMREQQAREQQMREQQAREQQMREQQAREQQMLEQQQQQQQRVGLETLFGVGGGASPPSQPNLLANIFGSAPQGASMGGARAPPPPGGEMMSLEDLERSMAMGGGGGSGLPPAPQPGSFDAPTAPWGGAGVDRPPLEDSGWISAPPPAGHQPTPQQQQQQQQQQQRQFEQVPAAPPSKPAWGGAAATDAGAGGGKSLAEIQAEEEERAAARQRELDARAKANPGFGGGPMATAWGGAGAGGGPSLAQIQAEELRQSRELEERRRAEQTRQAAAAPAGIGAGGPGLGAWGNRPSSVAQPPPQHQQPPQQPPSQQQPRAASAGFWDTLPPASGASPAAAGGAGGGARKPAPGGAVAPLNAPARAAEASPRPTNAAGFKEWCRAEMRALNGSDDTTLVDFLVSLPSAGEVTEYVQLYLGDNERAAAFGNELIRIKRTNPQIISGGGAAGGDFAGGGDGWEGGGKKGRRGKK